MATVKIDNLEINYIRQGEGRPVLILPGWNTTIEVYRLLIDAVSKYSEVITLDMPGFGKSSKLEESWNLDDQIEFVKKFVKALKLKEFDLIGHSNGGRTIIKMMAGDVDFKVGKIVLMGAAGIEHQKTAKQKAMIGAAKVAKKFIPKGMLEKMKQHAGSDDYRAAEPVMRDTLVKLVNEDLSEYLPKIKQPTLLIWGDLDTEAPVEDAIKMESLIPDAGLVRLGDCTHFAFVENPVYINRVIETFLKGE